MIFTDFIASQQLKAETPIDLIFFGMTMDVRLLQYWKV